MEVIKREERIVKKGKKFLFYVSDPAFLVGTSNLTSAKKPLRMKIVNQLLKKAAFENRATINYSQSRASLIATCWSLLREPSPLLGPGPRSNVS